MAKQDPIVGQVLADFAKDHKPHEVFVDRADACFRAYHGILENRSEAASWTNKQHPAIVLQAIETMAANLLSPSPRWKLRAYPRMDSGTDNQALLDGAKANELLLTHQLVLDHWAEKQRLFDLQGLITGVTAAKQFWLHREGVKKSRVFYSEPVHNLYGQQVGETQVNRIHEQDVVLRDDPTSEVIDVRHLIFQQGAASLAQCERVTHRCFYPIDKIREFAKQGYYGPEAGGQPISDLDSTSGGAQRFFQRENDLWQTQPHQDDVVILEQWREGGKRVVTVANDSVLLADKSNPFWFDHLEHPFPFAVCSGTPDLFRIPGISEAELMAELQEMLWTLMNQRLDNLQLINNAIFMIADTVEDPESLEFGPGEQWLLPPPVEQNVKSFSPDVRAAEVSVTAENMVRGDVQNVTGGMPFLSGTDSGTVDQNTATGVSIITSLAQKRLAAKKQQFVWAKARIGEQWCALNQQFVTAEREIPVIGHDGVVAFEKLRPELLQGDYIFETEVTEESLMRQEKRAEATSLYQMAVQAQPIMAASQTPWNLRELAEYVLDTFDIADKDRFFTDNQPQPGQLPPGQQQPGQQPPGQPQPGQSPNGVTNPALAAGQQSPSNPNSMSPEAAMQRFMAMRGVQSG